jgi:glycine/D-amino acid oxidase-like deaminating enzyme
MNTPTPTTNARWERLCCSGQSWYQIAEEMKLDCRQLERKLTAAREELETERIRLAACGVVAMADTKESRTKAREMLPEYRSASLSDVERRVDECIELREQRDRLAEALREVATYDPSDGQCNSGYSCKYIAEQALQSLNQPER